MRRFCKSVVSASVLFSTCAAIADPIAAPAQIVNAIQNLSNFYDPGRVSNQIQDTIPHTTKFAPRTAVTAPKPAATNNADKIHFKLMKVVIKGNTIFNKSIFAQVFRPSIKKEITLAQLQAMVHEVTAQFRESGFILTRAILPPQTIKDGIVTVQIVEGFISAVSIKGDIGRMGPMLDAYGARIMHSKPLQIHDLERYALLANDLPGIAVQTVITPSKTVPAGADLTLVVTRRRASGFISYDNYGTRYIGPDETTVGGSVYSVFVAGDSNNIRLSTTSNTHELRYIELTHSQPIGSNGLHWSFGSDFTVTRPDFILEPLSIIGRNFLVFTDFSYPIIRDRGKNWSVHSTANYQNSTSTILGQPFYQDRIRNIDLGTSYDYTDTYHGVSQLILDYTHGLPIFGAHDHQLQSRPDGQSSYTRINGSLSRLQGLNQYFSMYGVMKGQYSFQPLLATEQYGVGGPDIGRGYDPSEIVGDSGVAGKIELRLDTNPGFKFLASVEYFIFYDAGMVWNIDNVNLLAKQSLTSAGVGARFSFMPNVTGNFFVGRPLTHKVATMVGLGHNPNQPRGFFSVVLSV